MCQCALIKTKNRKSWFYVCIFRILYINRDMSSSYVLNDDRELFVPKFFYAFY